MNKSELIKRCYRITKPEDKAVKRLSKKNKLSESGYIRMLIDKDTESVAQLSK